METRVLRWSLAIFYTNSRDIYVKTLWIFRALGQPPWAFFYTDVNSDVVEVNQVSSIKGDKLFFLRIFSITNPKINCPQSIQCRHKVHFMEVNPQICLNYWYFRKVWDDLRFIFACLRKQYQKWDWFEGSPLPVGYRLQVSLMTI